MRLLDNGKQLPENKSTLADIKSQANPLFLREDELRQGIELLFYAYRDFTAEADAVLQTYVFGRAHHRVIYFVGRNPGMPVSALLDVLKITKQSLSRVLGQTPGAKASSNSGPDRTGAKRLLDLTPSGAELERRLTEDQRALVAQAYRAAAPMPLEGFRKVLFGLINEADRPKVARSVAARRGGDTSSGHRHASPFPLAWPHEGVLVFRGRFEVERRLAPSLSRTLSAMCLNEFN